MKIPTLVETYAQLPLTLVDGHMARVRDSAGREFWDFYGGHAVALLGQAHPAVARAICAQVQRLTFYSNVAPLEVRARAAERLCAFAPDGLEHVFFCNSGAEANENALKLAIQHTGRRRIAALRGAFHGRTLLALAASAKESLRLRPNDLDDVAQIDERVAAVIVEPILSTAGVVELRPEFLTALRRRCDAVGARLIYDEVQTGMGRLGRPLAAGQHGVLPDMVTLAKGIANGLPMGAVLMTPAVAAAVRLDDLGTTFGGGPLACAALLAVLDTIEHEELIEHARRLGVHMHARLRVGPVQEVRGCGCLIGLRLSGAAQPVQDKLLDSGFITGTSADPCVLRLLPPINLPVEAVDALAAALAALGVSADATLAKSA